MTMRPKGRMLILSLHAVPDLRLMAVSDYSLSMTICTVSRTCKWVQLRR